MLLFFVSYENLSEVDDYSSDDYSGDGSGDNDNSEDYSNGGSGDSSEGSGDEYQEGSFSNERILISDIIIIVS